MVVKARELRVLEVDEEEEGEMQGAGCNGANAVSRDFLERSRGRERERRMSDEEMEQVEGSAAEKRMMMRHVANGGWNTALCRRKRRDHPG